MATARASGWPVLPGTERPVLVLEGPTAVGKSQLAMELAAATGAEIVSMDSAQVYRGMDIGTAKPSAVEQATVAHHGIDCCDPEERYSAERFVHDARAAIAAIHARGRPALVVGGTHLYLRALLLGLDPMPPVDGGVRAALRDALARDGLEPLLDELRRSDPVTASRLLPGDTQRVLRALEVVRTTGQPWSSFQRGARRLAERELPPNWRTVALWPGDRAALRERIAVRFERMLDAGFDDELERLRARAGLTAEHPSQRAVGYRQGWAWRSGEIDRATFVSRAVAATRQYAKRQLTWLRNDPLSEAVSIAAGGCASREDIDARERLCCRLCAFLDG